MNRLVVCGLSLLTALAALTVRSHAQAEGPVLPNWPIRSICSTDSAPGQCALFESRARGRVAEAWLAIPDSIKAGCISEFRKPLEPSWRVMVDCIGELAVTARVAVRRGALQRDRAVAQKFIERRQQLAREAKRKADAEKQRVQEQKRAAAERKRLAQEEAALKAQLVAERDAARKAAEATRLAAESTRLAAERRARYLQELEERRLASEEASFLTLIAAQKKKERADAKAARAKAAALRAAAATAAAAPSLTAVAAGKKAGQPAANVAAAISNASAVPLIAGVSTAGIGAPTKAGQDNKRELVPVSPKKSVNPLLAAAIQAQPETIVVKKPAVPARKAKPVTVLKRTAKLKRSKDAVTCEERLEATASAGAVLFAFDSAELLKDAVITLDALAAGTRACGRIKLTIEGHTDAKGTHKYNQRLSEQRAENVANYLINAGVPAKRVRYVGYGELRPVEDNSTDEGRALNRRIEYSVQ